MGNHADRVARVQRNDVRLERVTALNAALDGTQEQLEEAWAQLRPLIDYYQGAWLSDLEALDDHPDGQHGVLSEDGVWNEMTTFHATLQTLQEVTTRILGEYEAAGQERSPRS